MPEINDAQRADVDVDELTPSIKETRSQIAVGYFWHDVAAGANAGRPVDQFQYSIGGRLYEVDKNAVPLDGGGDVSINCNAAANLADDIDAAVAAINLDANNTFAWNIDDIILAVANVANEGAAGNGLAIAKAGDGAPPDVFVITGALTVGGDDAEEHAVFEGRHLVEASDVAAWAAAGPSYTPINTFEVPVPASIPVLDYMQVWTATGQMRNLEVVAGATQLTHRFVNIDGDIWALEVYDETTSLVATDVITWQATAR
jgi:hypothetical protein